MPRLHNILLGSFLCVLAAGMVRDRIEQLPASGPFVPATIRFLLLPPESTIRMPLHSLRLKQIADTWHAPRAIRRLHEGQDLFAPKGTPVYSATDGVVVRVGEAGIGGNAVSVLGRGGRVYYYAHLSRFADNLAEGDLVTPDSILGYVGNTGNARTTPPHLHFGVYGSHGAMNPLPLLADVQQRTVADMQAGAMHPKHGRRPIS